MDQHLAPGSRVCIVGGGPAGSFAALHLLDQAAKHALSLEVLIFEPRDFTRPGPSGCNRCAGILSARLLAGMEKLGLVLPDELIQADVRSYAVHLPGATVQVERPGPQHRILSVYRGSGPRLQQGAPPASFDAYLLGQACQRGARVIAARVKEVRWETPLEERPEERPVVYTADASFTADLLVLAIGVNSRSPLAPDFGYHPPETSKMAQNEVLRPSTWPDDQVSVYFLQQPGVLFGALIPKGGYLNVSLLGHDLKLDTVQNFIDTQQLTASPVGCQPCASGALCGCTPQIAIRPAHHYFGPRWVAVGDASVVRLYKDGIGSAFYTAQIAMAAAVERGLAEADFAAAYEPFCRSIARDNVYGQVLFHIWALTLRTPRLLRAWINAIRQESALPPERRIHQRILWGMFTGEESYRTLFWLAMRPKAVFAVLRHWINP